MEEHQVGLSPARINCAAGRKDNVNNVHISQLNVELNTFSCYYSDVQIIRNNEFTDSVDNYKPLKGTATMMTTMFYMKDLNKP